MPAVAFVVIVQAAAVMRSAGRVNRATSLNVSVGRTFAMLGQLPQREGKAGASKADQRKDQRLPMQ
ncbi:hypothetical protein [Paraburkholderia tuberum]|uniref:hypothetical protein n=1 Tax=Paraburkholderia tuberum TaxID=157910 RepID=UPI000B84A0BE|nr:hypothetical protein [Paraburkholderia tuberum]